MISPIAFEAVQKIDAIFVLEPLVAKITNRQPATAAA